MSSARRTICAAMAAVVISCFSAAPQADAAFDSWLMALRSEALSRGLKQATVEAALRGVTPLPRVIELDRSQPEFTLTFDQYLSRVVSDERVKKGRLRLARHRALLKEVSEKYKVQPRFIVALWGIETDFGRLSGGFSVIQALVTLAYDGRRSAFFRKELFNALTIIDQGHVTAAKMTGSWAGAMGQNQFMPSSFLSFAVDYDGDGRRNIWTSRADVFASTANYLSKVGWRNTETWGREVRLPSGFDTGLADLGVRKSLQEWQRLGVRRVNGRDLPNRPLQASITLPSGPKGRAFLVYGNYRSIMKWNRSHFFATAVGHLADRIARN